jgi:hypothetical protein
VTPARPSPYGAWDHVLAPFLLAGWWAWHGPRLALEAARPAGGRNGR